MRARKTRRQFPTNPSIRPPSGYGSDYTEGNAWQYSWYVPQDVAGLIARAWAATPSSLAKLDQVFDAKVDPKVFADVEDITGLIG